MRTLAKKFLFSFRWLNTFSTYFCIKTIPTQRETHIVYPRVRCIQPFIWTILLLMVPISELFCQSNETNFELLYERGEYEKAAVVILSKDNIPHKFYNAAICYNALKKYSLVEAYLLKELSFAPNFAPARTLLNEVTSSSAGLKSSPRTALILWCKTHSKIIPAFICILPVVLLLFWLMLYRLTIFQKSLVFAFVLSLTFALSYGYLVRCQLFIPTGTESIMRTGPSLDHSVLSILDQDQIYEIERHVNDWLQVRASNGRKGWTNNSEGISL